MSAAATGHWDPALGLSCGCPALYPFKKRKLVGNTWGLVLRKWGMVIEDVALGWNQAVLEPGCCCEVWAGAE